MKNIVKVIAVLAITLIIGGCGAAKLSPSEQALVNAKVYTQVAMWDYKSTVIGTNYSITSLIPINSEVSISKVTSKAIIFTYKDKEIVFKNIPKYTGVDINGLLTRSFANKKVDLSTFDEKTQKNIIAGSVVTGMSKKAVILARGYAPVHETASFESNTWKYWKTRWNTILVEFKDNKVSKIID